RSQPRADRHRAHHLCAIWNSPVRRYDGTFRFLIHPLMFDKKRSGKWRQPNVLAENQDRRRITGKGKAMRGGLRLCIRRRVCAAHPRERSEAPVAQPGRWHRIQGENDETAAGAGLHRVIHAPLQERVFWEENFWAEQRFSAALKCSGDAASAAEVLSLFSRCKNPV